MGNKFLNLDHASSWWHTMQDNAKSLVLVYVHNGQQGFSHGGENIAFYSSN